MDDRLQQLLEQVRRFVREREWEAFHDPKNLAMAVASEAGELAAELRWVPSEQADAWSQRADNRARLADEIGDVGITLLMLADRVGLDLADVMDAKLAKTCAKYPVEQVRGRFE